ncbi:MAG TPA: hypothetical protein VFJ86_11165 [Usitatibacter sp.]|nr:hypothetical protein [Usitatibacter sp.]
MDLFELLGKNIAAPEVAQRLADYPGLRPEPGDTSADDRAIGVKYLRSTRDGLLIKLSDEGEILALFMLSEGKDGGSEFRGELPGKLNFAAEPDDAIRVLGTPDLRREPTSYGGHRLGEFLRFDRPAYSIHIQFRADHDGIDLITAMVARQVPGRSHANASG